MNPIAIYLVDDHSLFREGLKFLLSGIDTIGTIYEADNGQQFLDGLKTHPVELALIDIEMPVVNGIDAARQALERCPDLKIIALSMYSDESYYASMIDAGANGFLLKNSNFAEVKRAIENVLAGKNYFSLEILQAILKGHRTKSKPHTEQQLTEREAEILRLICDGLSNPEIADRLELSKRTVDKHRENLLQKTQSKNTASLVIYAIKNDYYQI
ncbi:response regulator transcription factor [Mangrovibacterium marinum]|uniref:LuxR family two component transcriptional regulator n=1 Tax=Mangrovibacterium marinum TaxID=1639118 RepID=A0A2T5C5C5_9BACT|nr:response regulator transcription factor [Mangrovibacterium marinum]PTN10110.1 LuxR family two component transcriptional regulator [Mangrovibacterium marinum]